MTTTPQQTRSWTDIDRLAEAHLDASVALSPLEATYLGVPGADDRIDDLSVAGLRTRRDLCADTLEQLDRLEPQPRAARDPAWKDMIAATPADVAT